MIAVNELRIGNWVSFHPNKKIIRHCQVIAINGSDIVVLDKGQSLISYFELIPLTPEILEKAGFLKTWLDAETTRCWDYELNEFHLHVLGDDLITFMTRKINWLHQLQNLYFALTGEELTIEL